MTRPKRTAPVVLLACCCGAFANDDLQALRAQQAYLRTLPLGQLVELDVTSVSRRPQSLSEAAAAVFVITAEDIRRSGATSVPEVLRMVPGVHVARLDASKWAITARGFNNRFANKLLVLVDGRSVYTSLFSGVYWDEQDLLLEEVERIEVIRGPGAALWGANAVNGVINVVSRAAAGTQGTRLLAGIGNEEKGFTDLRHGGRLGETGHYRVYGRWFSRDGGLDPDGNDAPDDWDQRSLGLRMEGAAAGGDWLLDGRAYDGHLGQVLKVPDLEPPYVRRIDDPVETEGAHLLGRWSRRLDADHDYRLQLYFDRVERADPAGLQQVDTWDLDFQQRHAGWREHQVLWGLGLRYIDHRVSAVQVANPIAPARHRLRLYSAFLQDQVALMDHRLQVTLGAKLEHNDFTGFEWQPNLRAAFKPRTGHTLWASISRAVRTPSIFERDGSIPFQVLPGEPPTELRFVGDEGFDSETLIAYELGYRVRPVPRLGLDLAAYYNDYRDLRTAELGEPTIDPETEPHPVVPLYADNRLRGKGYGLELAAKWHPRDDLRFDLAYTWFELDLELEEGSSDTYSALAGGEDPRHQVSLRSGWDPAADWELDAWWRYVDPLPSLGVDRYLTLDLRLGWRLRPGVTLSLVGQNLLGAPRREFVSRFVQNPATRVERGLYVALDWRL